MPTLIRVLFGAIIVAAGLYLGLAIRPSGIYDSPCHYSPQHSCR